MLILDYLIAPKNKFMAKKIKQTSQKSLKKTLLDQIESNLTKSLIDFPKKISEKKYLKTIHKAGKILRNSLAISPVQSVSQTDLKKAKKKKRETKVETTL